MKLLYLSYCGPFEADGFFTETGDLIHLIDQTTFVVHSDAHFEYEYLSPLLVKLGIPVERVYQAERPDLVEKMLEWTT